ncbi:NAD(P)H-hydrate dehydratase [Actinacidiphila oryziradicis]|uniref:NAD(P)H-hydrate dehydratase n=1 Tax=Actinacidiphila oryziradicis TaxID=2571141 RepID=UPI003898F23F
MPHAGETAALLGVARGEALGQRLSAVRDWRRSYAATVLLKGSTTLIAPPSAGPARPA